MGHRHLQTRQEEVAVVVGVNRWVAPTVAVLEVSRCVAHTLAVVDPVGASVVSSRCHGTTSSVGASPLVQPQLMTITDAQSAKSASRQDTRRDKYHGGD